MLIAVKLIKIGKFDMFVECEDLLAGNSELLDHMPRKRPVVEHHKHLFELLIPLLHLLVVVLALMH